MLITCEECNSRFQLDDSHMKDEGVKVKCSKCGKIFIAYPSSIEISAEAATGVQGVEEELERTEENGLDFSEMEAMLSESDNLGLDISSGETSDITDSGFGFDETNELDLSDMDQLFGEDEISEVESFAETEPEEIDLELDEVQDTVPSLGSTNGISEEIEELDFIDSDDGSEEMVASVEEIEELDMERDEENDTAVSEIEEENGFSIDGESLSIETDSVSDSAETVEEIGMSDIEMEDMFAADDQTDDVTSKGIDEDAELSFDLQKELDVGEISEEIEPEEIEPEEDIDEFEELGLTDLEEMFTLDEDQKDEEVEAEEMAKLEEDETFELPEDSEGIEIGGTDMPEMQLESGDVTEVERSGEDTDEFEEFGLTDLEEMFNLEAEQKPEEPEPAVEDSHDVEFGDEDMIDGDHEELEFKLDEAIAVLDGSSEEEIGVEFEEYEELDLSELDEMFDKEEIVRKEEDNQKEELGDLDFGIDTLPEAEEVTDESSTEEDLGIADTSELDFSDIGEMLESDEEIEQGQQELDLPDTSGIVEDESDVDFGPEPQTPVEDESESDELTEVVEDVEDKEDIAVSDDNFDLSDDDLDLSEMEKMLQEADSLEKEISTDKEAPATPPPLPEAEMEEESIDTQEDLDFGLDEEDTQEDLFQSEDTQDIELEFGVEEEGEEEEKEEPPPIKPAEVTETPKSEEDIEAKYDMGIQLDELRKKQAAEKLKGITAEEKIPPGKKTKPERKKKPIPFEKKKTSPVLVVVLILILIVGVPIALTNMGIKIPYVSDFISGLDIKIPFADKIKQANIPYISDMLTSGERDALGINKITILEPSLNGYYLENESAGVIFIISGNVRNDYDQLRSFISVKGQIYSKGKTHIESKTVYAGNTLSEEELSTSNPAAIDKQLKNKYGDKRSNFKLTKGKTVPFMIVFAKVPGNLEGYDVEVTGSTLFQAEGGGK